MRRATGLDANYIIKRANISIHALHEESDKMREGLWHKLGISIHALHEESDNAAGETLRIIPISIHALHEESDSSHRASSPTSMYFNPRSP